MHIDNKIKKVSTYLFICFLLLSCNKYLEKKQNSSLNVPSSLTDLQALLDYAGVVNQQRTPSYGEVSCDEYFLTTAGYNSRNSAYQSYYTWQPYYSGTSSVSNDWAAGYQVVYISNLALDLLKKISQTKDNEIAWSNIKGSALFYRSYYFLWLLWDYAKAYDSSSASKDLGIALRETSDFNVPSVRSNNQECYEQVIKDTKTSIQLLPDYPDNVMRPSKGAAYGLLARCYLSMRDYKNALIYSDSCLLLNHELMDYNNDDDIPSGLSVNSPFAKFNKEIIFYSEMNLFYGSLYLLSSAGVDSVLYKLFDKYDLRKTAFFRSTSNGYMQFKGNYGFSSAFFSGIAVDELYLIRSECYIRLGQIQQGLNDLNTLLKMRYSKGYFNEINETDETKALNIIVAERRKELIMRGVRWADLKRLNKEGANIILQRFENDNVYTLQPNDPYYALPLPEDIVQMTDIPQNN